MITLLLTTLIYAADTNIGHTLELAGYMRAPVAIWADLDNDGHTDIWVKSKDDNLWIWDGAQPEAGFTKLEYEPIGLKVRPYRFNNQWRPSVWSEGMLLVFEENWHVIHDVSQDAAIRPGALPVLNGNQSLAPTFDGYQLMEDTCLIKALPVIPSVNVKKRALELTWPVPEWSDVDGDGDSDIISPPILFPQHGELRVWSVFNDEGSWNPVNTAVEMPSGLEIVKWETGDMNRDDYPELVILAMPSKDLSIFEELSFMIYEGTGRGQWERAPLQVLKTKQNLWQQGPVEINRNGILLYYYKGIFRSHFKMDLFKWNPAGYIEPKPESRKWKMEDADRGFIETRFDWNEDGAKDLMLMDERGVRVYFRYNGNVIPYDENRNQLLSGINESNNSMSVNIGGSDMDVEIRGTGVNSARGNKSMALVTGGKVPQLWYLIEQNNGHWQLKRLK